jgi:MFS family permease
MTPFDLYGRAIRAPGVARLVASSLIGRLPLGMMAISTLIYLRAEHYDLGSTGLLVGMLGVGQAVMAPATGRLIDARGAGKVLLPLALVFPIAVAATIVISRSGGPVWLLVATCFLSGASIGPLGPCLRSVWPGLLTGDDLRAAAYTADATLQELVYLVGPVLATTMIALWSPVSAMVAAACFGVAGGLWFASSPKLPVGERTAARVVGRRSWLGPLREPVVLVVVSIAGCLGASWSALQLAVATLAESRGTPQLAGFTLAAFGVGSLAGGVVSAALPKTITFEARVVAASALFTATLAGTPFLPSLYALMALLFAAGIPSTIVLAALYTVTGTRGRPESRTEAFAWTTSIVFLGGSVGSLTAGQLGAEAGAAAGLVAATLFGCGSCTVAFCGRRILRGDQS